MTALVATAIVLVFTGCGGDDENGTTSAPDTAADATTASYDITVEEFILATNKQEILDEYMANEPNNCSKVDDDFILTASAAATNFPDDAPLDDVIVDICGEP